jgi:hypothetical protein
MKAILRIAIFSVGGLLAVVGVLMLIAALIPGSADKAEPIWGVVIAPFLLVAGIAVCALAPRARRPATSAQTMSREERLVQDIRDHMKKRWSLIGLCAVSSLVMLSCSAFAWWQGTKLDAMVTPELFHPTDAVGIVHGLVPTQLSSVYALAGARTRFLLKTHLFAAYAGIFLAALIIESAGLTRQELTLAMWERIQRLEDQIKDLQQRG